MIAQIRSRSGRTEAMKSTSAYLSWKNSRHSVPQYRMLLAQILTVITIALCQNSY